MTSPAGEPKSADQVMPEGKWTFDGDVTDAFDDMLRRSIPQYDVMRQAVFEVGSLYVRPNTAIVDLGCSRGEAMAPFVDRFGAHNHFVGIEVSEPMLAAARERFAGMIECGVVEIRELDLRTEYPPWQASLTLAVLILQFTPIEYRQRICRQMYEATVPGGAVIVVEKVLGATAPIDQVMVEQYLGMKRQNGYTMT